MTTSTSPTSSGSSADVTSSNSITCGFIISARAIATRCCCPPDSWCGYCVGLLAQPDDVEQLVGARLGVAPRQMPDPPCRERQVVHHLQVREEVELLEDDPDPLCGRRDVDALARDLLALEEDPALLDRLEQVDAPQQRALAASARPDHDEHLAALRRSGRSRRGRGCRRSSCGRLRAGRPVSPTRSGTATAALTCGCLRSGPRLPITGDGDTKVKWAGSEPRLYRRRRSDPSGSP